MNADDEIFLSAYLDGELESEQRQRVETAMLSDSRLLDHLLDGGLPGLAIVRSNSDLHGLRAPVLQTFGLGRRFRRFRETICRLAASKANARWLMDR